MSNSTEAMKEARVADILNVVRDEQEYLCMLIRKNKSTKKLTERIHDMFLGRWHLLLIEGWTLKSFVQQQSAHTNLRLLKDGSK